MSKRARKSEQNSIDQLPTFQEAAWLKVLIEDAPLVAVNKPAGVLSQGAPQGSYSLPEYVKAFLKQKYDKPGNVYLGVVHRLDRPVTGVVVFSRNSKGAARLAEQFRERKVTKTYLALLEHRPEKEEGVLRDFIRKIPDQARAELSTHETAEAKLSELKYRVLGAAGKSTLVEVNPLTGRMHQIRLQFASRGCPIVGDQLYGARTNLDGTPLTDDYTTNIGLHAWKLKLFHPVRYDEMTISAPLPETWPADARTLLQSIEEE